VPERTTKKGPKLDEEEASAQEASWSEWTGSREWGRVSGYRLSYRSETMELVLAALGRGDTAEARELVRSRYPFDSPLGPRRNVSQTDRVRVFLRDGFIDRYTGDRLYFPPVLELISLEIPDAFPSHPNGKFTESHVAHWELSASVDHKVALARGGSHTMENWITTSMMRNQVKSHWRLEDLGWSVFPEGSLEEWDGALGWFLNRLESPRGLELLSGDEREQSWSSISWLREWQRAALRAMDGATLPLELRKYSGGPDA